MALTSVTIANVWFGMPFSMILIAAALTGIPEEQYEAAVARRRRSVRALPLHHAAGAVGRRCSRSPAW